MARTNDHEHPPVRCFHGNDTVIEADRDDDGQATGYLRAMAGACCGDPPKLVLRYRVPGPKEEAPKHADPVTHYIPCPFPKCVAMAEHQAPHLIDEPEPLVEVRLSDLKEARKRAAHEPGSPYVCSACGVMFGSDMVRMPDGNGAFKHVAGAIVCIKPAT